MDQVIQQWVNNHPLQFWGFLAIDALVVTVLIMRLVASLSVTEPIKVSARRK